MSEEEQVVDLEELDPNVEEVQTEEAEEVQNEAEEQDDEESTTVLVAYNLETGEELDIRTFPTDYAERILSISNSGWKRYEEARAKIGIVIYSDESSCTCDCYDGNANGVADAIEDFADDAE